MKMHIVEQKNTKRISSRQCPDEMGILI